MKFFRGFLATAFRTSPWICILFVLRLPEKLVEDRVVSYLNRRIDESSGGFMPMLSKSVLFFLKNPALIVVGAILLVLAYSLVREHLKEQKEVTEEKGHPSFVESLKHVAVSSILLLALVGATRGCEKNTPVNRQVALVPPPTAIPQNQPRFVVPLQKPKLQSKRHENSASKPSVKAPPSTPVNNYAPGGIAISGGIVNHPQVNNNRPPPPPIESTIAVIRPIPKGAYPRGEGSPAYDRPGIEVRVTLLGVFYTPAFSVRCSVPCMATEQMFETDTGSSGFSGDAEFLHSSEYLTAFVMYRIGQLQKGTRLILTFRSLDDQQLAVSAVKTYAPVP